MSLIDQISSIDIYNKITAEKINNVFKSIQDSLEEYHKANRLLNKRQVNYCKKHNIKIVSLLVTSTETYYFLSNEVFNTLPVKIRNHKSGYPTIPVFDS